MGTVHPIHLAISAGIYKSCVICGRKHGVLWSLLELVANKKAGNVMSTREIDQSPDRHGHADSSMSSRTRMRTFKMHEDEDKDEDSVLK